MTTLERIIGIVTIGAVVGLGIATWSQNGKLGGVYTRVNNSFYEGLKAGTSDQLSVSSTGALTTSGNITTTGDATISGGSLTVTSTNTATSSIAVGCVQMSPTSTATKVKLEFNTTSGTSTTNGQADGLIAWKYGTCP